MFATEETRIVSAGCIYAVVSRRLLRKCLYVKRKSELLVMIGRPNLSGLKEEISPIFMAQTIWNHGPEMLEGMRRAKRPWQKIDEKEMVDLLECLNWGMP